eukprot:g353.t1
MPLGHDDGRGLFFWLVEPLSALAAPQSQRAPKLGIWLQGGPGCSSMAGFFLENGPLRVHPAGGGGSDANASASASASTSASSSLPWRIEWNPLTWSETVPMLYVEQPAGVGFSPTGAARSGAGGIVTDEHGVAADFARFLRGWLSHPAFERYRDTSIFFFGESYAGKYVPAIVDRILQEQRDEGAGHPAGAAAGSPPHVDTRINLGGMALGNGWIDPVTQTPAYIDYALGHGLVGAGGAEHLRDVWRACAERAEAARRAVTRLPEAGAAVTSAARAEFRTAVSALQNGCGIMEMVQAASAHANEYDTSLFGEYEYLDPPCATGRGDAACAYVSFLQDERVQRALHAAPPRPRARADGRKSDTESARPWQLCSAAVNTVLMTDTPVSVLPALARVLDTGLPTLLYFGERDLSCNFLGAQRFLASLPWRGRDGYNAAPRAAWRVAPPPPALAPFDRAAAVPAPGESTEGLAVSGFVRAHANLHFLLVLNSGHLVPFSQPWRALDLVRRFIHGRSFADQLLPAWDVGAGASAAAGWADSVDRAAAAGVDDRVAKAPEAGGTGAAPLPVWLLTTIAFAAGAALAAPLAIHALRLSPRRDGAAASRSAGRGGAGVGSTGDLQMQRISPSRRPPPLQARRVPTVTARLRSSGGVPQPAVGSAAHSQCNHN